ncbi:hypothetical protein [Gallibacterium anatis]|uniref:Uncharacterized protein n=1 Tax=Gallibacterium anatis (strain UMN179) TaxID=1005058 RepID=F4HBX1_GALAU|nr:hypothetical protein [Gallibacterium anatis]AEC16398.1 hypothetical protein UMN179_00361 [Gallibacterium anatis UMN179]KGQ32728.1 hypothetical protein JP34_09165 [Gallibacterium anatis]MBP4132427.1 hypothetical protein [Gallibacterium anatis]
MSKFHQNIFNILCEVNNVQKINIELFPQSESSNKLITVFQVFLMIMTLPFFSLAASSQEYPDVFWGISFLLVILAVFILIYDKIKKPISISEQHQELYQESLALLQSYEIVKNDISEDEYLSYIRKKSYSCLIEKNPTVEEIRNYLN